MTYSEGEYVIDIFTTVEELRDSEKSYHYYTEKGTDVEKRELPSLTSNVTLIEDWTQSRADPWYTSALNHILAPHEKNENPAELLSGI